MGTCHVVDVNIEFRSTPRQLTKTAWRAGDPLNVKATVSATANSTTAAQRLTASGLNDQRPTPLATANAREIHCQCISQRHWQRHGATANSAANGQGPKDPLANATVNSSLDIS